MIPRNGRRDHVIFTGERRCYWATVGFEIPKLPALACQGDSENKWVQGKKKRTTILWGYQLGEIGAAASFNLIFGFLPALNLIFYASREMYWMLFHIFKTISCCNAVVELLQVVCTLCNLAVTSLIFASLSFYQERCRKTLLRGRNTTLLRIVKTK